MPSYEIMKETVVMSAFVFIIMFDIWGVGYWVVKLVKWIMKKYHDKKDAPADTEAAEEVKTD